MIFRKNVILLLLIYLLSISYSWSQIDSVKNELKKTQEKELQLKKELEVLELQVCVDSLRTVGYPTSKKNITVLEHSAMIIGYSCEEKLPAWVYHVITPEILNGNVGRTNNFRADPKVSCIVGGHSDYTKATIENGKKKYVNYGYDRGHLAPSADFKWSKIALSESFYFTNITPQRPDFNRIYWSNLEDKIRKSLDHTPYNHYVVTGPVLYDYTGVTGGPNDISVPKYFFKAIVRLGNNPSGIGFIMPNENCEKGLSQYVVSIDSIEKLTGLDLFPSIHKSIQDKIESQSNYNEWNFEIAKGDVSPLDATSLPKNVFNTYQAQNKVGKTVQVVGKVVSVKYDEKSGATFLNLDRSFPYQSFTILIWKGDLRNFSYSPHIELKGKTIIVKGQVLLDKNDIPSMNIKNENQVTIYEGE